LRDVYGPMAVSPSQTFFKNCYNCFSFIFAVLLQISDCINRESRHAITVLILSQFISASEMTYIVSSGALNSTHLLTHRSLYTSQRRHYSSKTANTCI